MRARRVAPVGQVASAWCAEFWLGTPMNPSTLVYQAPSDCGALHV